MLTGPRITQLENRMEELEKKMNDNVYLRMEAYFGRAWQSGVLTSVARDAMVNIIKDTKLMKTFASRIAWLLPGVKPPDDFSSRSVQEVENTVRKKRQPIGGKHDPRDNDLSQSSS